MKDLKEKKYQTALENLEKSSEKMSKTKEEYEDKKVLLGDSKYYLQTEEYEIEFLWTKIGNYAKKDDVELKIDVTSSQLSNKYNLNFTVSGAYTDVIQFIYDIEGDSKLGFKIENFSMNAGVTATFTCKDIRINLNSKNTTEISNNVTIDTTKVDEVNNTESTEEITNTIDEKNTVNETNTSESQDLVDKYTESE